MSRDCLEKTVTKAFDKLFTCRVRKIHTHLMDGYTVLSVSSIVFNTLFLLGHITILPRETFSKFVHVIRCLETENFDVSINHEIKVTVKVNF